ncbi:MAG: hypothetical protein Q9208_008082 [Pyrenodesmia sp. 3 TL-2023]
MPTLSTSTVVDDHGCELTDIKTPTFEYRFWTGISAPRMEQYDADHQSRLYGDLSRFDEDIKGLFVLRNLLRERLELEHPGHALWGEYLEGLLEKVQALVVNPMQVLQTSNFEYHFWTGGYPREMKDELDPLYNEDRRFARDQSKLPEYRDLLKERHMDKHLDAEKIPAHAVWQEHIKGLLQKVGGLVDELAGIGEVLEEMGGLMLP